MASLTDLPPELLDHITSYLPNASAVSRLSSSSKSLKQVVDKDGWATFNRSRFPSIQLPHVSKDHTPSYHKDVARTLTTLSRNWDKRAFAARYTEPVGSITSYPGANKVERWKRPRGQTIGFTPQLDSYETVGAGWGDRTQVLAFSAGAGVCIRSSRSLRGPVAHNARIEGIQWSTCRPPDALEGRDDVTSLHLLRPREDDQLVERANLIRGTANGALELVSVPLDAHEKESSGVDSASKITFKTDNLPVRSTSLLQLGPRPSLLAATLGETDIAVYSLSDDSQSERAPMSQIEVQRPQNGSRTYRTWTSNFISSTHLAIGVGPSEHPIHVYCVEPSGISKDSLRKFSLHNDLERLEGNITFAGFAKNYISSVYPVVPLPSSSGNDGLGPTFLSGAYDGIVRLHDLRSDRQVEQAYIDPTMDDSAIYSLLPRGHEKLIVGTARHSLLKVFDMRMGGKNYSYLSGAPSLPSTAERSNMASDWNLFLKPHSATYPGRGGGNNWARRSAESSIYSLTSPSASSPFVYAGVENAVVELAFTDLFDPKPDPAFFDANLVSLGRNKSKESGKERVGDVLNLAMYGQSVKMELMTQRGIGEMRRLKRGIQYEGWKGDWFVPGLDERWRIGS